MTNTKVQYVYDLIRINSFKPEKKLRFELPMTELKKFCLDTYTRVANVKARQWGYKSQLIIIAPTEKYFELLKKYERQFWNYKISYIEISRDTFFSSLHEADQYRELTRQTYCKKWSTFIKSKRNRYRRDYYGRGKFRIIRYVRKSKINNKPCLREEFRLWSATEIKMKTGISKIGDSMDPKTIFRELESKYVEFVEIDKFTLGLWLIEKTKKKKPSKKIKEKAIVEANRFLKRHGIKTYAELKYYLSKQKKLIKKNVVVKSKWEKRVLTVQYHKFKKQT